MYVIKHRNLEVDKQLSSKSVCFCRKNASNYISPKQLTEIQYLMPNNL